MSKKEPKTTVRTLSEMEIWYKAQENHEDPLYFDKELTEAQNEVLDQIHLFAQNGSSLTTIAKSFGVDLGTMKRYFRTEMGVDALRVYEKAKAWGQLQTEESLYGMTTSGKDLQATKFWLERRAPNEWEKPEAEIVENNYILVETCETDA